MVVSSVMGHIFESDFDQSMKSWFSCDPEILLSEDTPVMRFVPEVPCILLSPATKLQGGWVTARGFVVSSLLFLLSSSVLFSLTENERFREAAH